MSNDKRHMNTLRWLLIVPLGMAGLAVGILTILFLQSVAMWFCPAELVISGACAASWHSAAEKVAMCVGSAIGAAAVVFLPSLTAPRSRQLVAVVAYCLGAACAISLLVVGGALFLLPFSSAIAGGALALWRVFVKQGAKMPPNLSIELTSDGLFPLDAAHVKC